MSTPWPSIPANVIAEVTRRWPSRGPAWSAAVPDELKALCARYHAIPRRVMRARYGFVIAATSPTADLIFRASPDPHGHHQVRVAQALADLNVGPRIHEIDTTPSGTWTVMDQVQPGTSIGDLDPTAVSFEAVIAPLQAMLNQPAPDPNMPSIADWLHDRLKSDHLDDLAPGRSTAPTADRDRALGLLDELTATGPADQLCHGDLSGWNILTAGPNQYLYIDPRGVTGEPTYDAAILALKSDRHVPTTVSVPYLAERLGINRERIEAWMTIGTAARV
jgi:streptomycin 6-kinase